MGHQAVAAELRNIATCMMDTKRHADADKIKLLLRSYFDDAARVLKPVWPLLQSPLPWVASWKVALPALRHLLDGRALPTDSDAFKHVQTAEYRETNGGEIDCDWDRYRLIESNMTEPQREAFYYAQARSWSDLLLRFASMVEVESAGNGRASAEAESSAANKGGRVSVSQNLVELLRAACPQFARDDGIERLIRNIETDENLKHLKTKHPDREKAYGRHLKAKKHPKYPRALAEYERRLSVNSAEN